MLSLSILLTALGFYSCYSTSKRAMLPKGNPVVLWASSNAKTSKYLGLFLLTFGLILCVINLGLGSGSFSFLVILMTIASIQVLIGPLFITNSKQLAVVSVLALILELFL